MRKIIRAIFVISALVALVLCSACVFPSFGEQKKQEGGLTQVTVPVESARISFEEAYQKLKEYRMDSSRGSAESKRIYYFSAKDVDDSGNATSWVFGVKNITTNELLIFNGKRWTVIPWIITTLPSEEIAVDQIVLPGNLFSRNKAVILSNSKAKISERKDLELQKGIYKLTIYTGSASTILSFNATTGELIT